MKKYTTLLLDVDNTLLDFNATEEKALALTFETYGITYDEVVKTIYRKINHELWRQYEAGQIEKPQIFLSRFVLLFEEMGINEDGVKFEKDYQYNLSEFPDEIEGAVDLVRDLSQYFDLYVVTNGVQLTQEKRLKASGLEKFMKDIFISEVIGYQKPSLEFFDYCFSNIPGLDKSQTIIIGDSLSSDILGGNNAGIDTCWYNPMGAKGKETIEVTYEIKDLSELKKILYHQ